MKYIYKIYIILYFNLIKEAGIEETRKEGDNLPTVSAADSDMDTGSLVIDEEKKKSMKRRTFSTAVIYI